MNEATRKASPGFVASRLHTAIVLLALVVAAAGGPLLQRLSGSDHLVGPGGRLPFYARVLAIQFLLFWFVRTGMRRSGHSVRALVDPSPWNAGRWARYGAIAVAGWILWMAVGAALGYFLRPSPEELRRLAEILPKDPLEKLGWVGFSVGISLCEEFLFRGYLLRQFRALTASPAAGLLLQAAVFAMGHASLGVALAVSIGLLGLGLGALALWQKSLVPGMIVHAGIGLLGGLFSPAETG